MRRRIHVRALAVCAAMILTSTIAFAADNWVGSWTLNLAKSKFASGPAPKSQTLKWESTADGIKLTSDGVDADGKATHSEYVSKYDGKEVAWTGNPLADTAAPKRIDDNHYLNTWKLGGKVTVNAKVAVSADGKTLTVRQIGKSPDGKPVNSTAVYDRQ